MGNLRRWQALGNGANAMCRINPKDCAMPPRCDAGLHEIYLRRERPNRRACEAAANNPFLGVCVGMQNAVRPFRRRRYAGLALVAGKVKRFPRAESPAHGAGTSSTPPHALWQDIPSAHRFYYVHSFFCEPMNPALAIASTDYCAPFHRRDRRGQRRRRAVPSGKKAMSPVCAFIATS